MKLNSKNFAKLKRELLSLSVLLCVCAVLIPFPVATQPQNATGKDISTPFPCQNRPCGCRSAQQCWNKCCCFNNAQKVAWATANNVKVPKFAPAAAKEQIHDVADLEICSSPAAYGRPSSTAENTASYGHSAKNSGAAVKPSCCSKPEDSSHDDTPVMAKHRPSDSFVACRKQSAKGTFKPSQSPGSSKSKLVLAIYAAECQGHGPAFCFPASVMPQQITLVMPTVAVTETACPESERLPQTLLRSPLPPPKIVPA